MHSLKLLRSRKVVQLLESLSSKEQDRFRQFLAADLHNSRAVIRSLFRAVREMLESGRKQATVGEVWEMIYPGVKFRNLKMRHHFSELNTLLGEFLVGESLGQNPFDHSAILGKELSARGLDHLFSLEKKQIEKRISKTEVILDDQWLLRYRWAQASSNLELEVGRKQVDDLSVYFHGLNEWVALQVLRQACTYLSRQNLSAGPTDLHADIPFLAGVLEWMRIRGNEAPVLARLYFAAYCLFDRPESGPFPIFLDLLSQYRNHLPQQETKALHLLGINHAIRQLNSGDTEALPILQQLYQRGLDNGWLYEQGMLSPWTFKNIVSVYLKLGQLDQAESFIEDESERIPESHRYDYRQQTLAELYLAQGQFSQVLETLRFVNNRDPITHSRLRVIYLKAIFELQERTLLDQQLDNFDRYLRGSKHSTYHQTRYREFNRLVRQLANLPPGPGKKRQELQEAIRAEPELLEWNWLMEKSGEET